MNALLSDFNPFAPSLPAERAPVAAGQIPAPGPVPAVTSNSISASAETCGSVEGHAAETATVRKSKPTGGAACCIRSRIRGVDPDMSHARGAGIKPGPQDSIIQPTPQAPNPGVETRREKRITASPAAFSFQPDFEKLFNEIMGTA